MIMIMGMWYANRGQFVCRIWKAGCVSMNHLWFNPQESKLSHLATIVTFAIFLRIIMADKQVVICLEVVGRWMSCRQDDCAATPIPFSELRHISWTSWQVDKSPRVGTCWHSQPFGLILSKPGEICLPFSKPRSTHAVWKPCSIWSIAGQNYWAKCSQFLSSLCSVAAWEPCFDNARTWPFAHTVQAVTCSRPLPRGLLHLSGCSTNSSSRQEEKTGQLTTAYLDKLQTNYNYILDAQQAPVFWVNGLQPTSVVLNEVTKILHLIHPFGPQTLPSGSGTPNSQDE